MQKLQKLPVLFLPNSPRKKNCDSMTANNSDSTIDANFYIDVL